MRATLRKILLAAAALSTSLGVQAQAPTNLPLLDITTTDGSDPFSKTMWWDCNVSRFDGTAKTDYGTSRIRLRGNSTAGLAKKPYRLKFYQKQRMLGSDRANAKNWALLANHTDKTLLRNAVAFRIAELMGGMDFVPGTQFVDLSLNGRYRGTYQLTDHIDIRKKRINITEQDTVPGAGHDISGGYLLELDHIGESEDIYFHTSQGLCIVVKSPDSDVISREQLDYVKQFMQGVENRVNSLNYMDPEQGYRAAIDSLSLASWYITNELAGNADMFWANYMYKEKGDPLLYFGPVWDFDIAFNNCQRKGDVSNSLMIDRGFRCDDASVGLWISRMWQDPWFQQLIWRTWSGAVRSGIEQKVIEYVDSMAAVVNESQALNFGLYDISKRVYDEYVLFNSYEAGVDFLKKEFSKRVALLTNEFAARCGITDPSVEPDPKPEPVPEPEPNPLDSIVGVPEGGRYYAIYNHGASMPITADDSGLAVLGRMPEDPDALPAYYWLLKEIADGEGYMLVHQGTGLSMADTSGGETGVQLSLAEPDSDDLTQQWLLEQMDSTLHTYCIVNRATNLVWNNRGGGTDVGNQLIAWLNDSDNPKKPTRQWRFVPVDFEGGDNGDEDGILDPTVANYVVSYSPSLRRLRFTAYSPDPMEGSWTIHDLSGRQVAAGAIAPEVTIPELPATVHILTWQTGGHRHSIKLVP